MSGLRNKANNSSVPLVGSLVEININTFTATVLIEQHYHNIENVPIEAVFKFPVDELSAVYLFEAVVDGKILVGEVQEKFKAQQTYSDAISSGKGAYLLEKGDDNWFTMNVGNLSPDKMVILKLGYVTELLTFNSCFRFNLPTAIVPSPEGGLAYKTDLKGRIFMPTTILTAQCNYRSPVFVQKLEHNIASFGANQLEMEQDFVLDIQIESVHELPRVQSERLPSKIVHGKGIKPPSPLALALYFWPNYPDTQEYDAEILFLIDRSGSMEGASIDQARTTMFQALKHMPSAAQFNIIGFGSSYKPLFPEPQPCNSKSLYIARKHIETLKADMGGTELMGAFQYIHKLHGRSKTIFLLSDGQVSNTDAVISLVRNHSDTTKVFTFGIGSQVDRNLIINIAAASQGQHVFISREANMETLVIQQIHTAIQPSYTDITLTWFSPMGPIVTGIQQAPIKLPPIFNNQLYTVYALIESIDFQFSHVALKAVGRAGELEFVLPANTQVPPIIGYELHRLAARSLIREMEEDSLDRKFEVVDLSLQYNLASKHASFVIVEERREVVEMTMEFRDIPSIAPPVGLSATRSPPRSSLAGKTKVSNATSTPSADPSFASTSSSIPTGPSNSNILPSVKRRMNQLLKRLQKIQDECVEKKALVQQEQGDIDEFTALKKKVAADLSSLRQKIKERDELEASTSGTRHTVEASHEIRKLIRGVKEDARKMEGMQKAEEEKFRKKNKENPEMEAKIENRDEVVKLIGLHIKEVEGLNTRRHGDNGFYGNSENKDPVITSLPDIDDAGFQMLRENDRKIDDQLDVVSDHLRNLKEIATEMGKEANAQGIMLDNLDHKADVLNDQLENLNERLRKVIESVRKGDRFIIDIILLCVLLGIAGYIYHLVSS